MRSREPYRLNADERASFKVALERAGWFQGEELTARQVRALGTARRNLPVTLERARDLVGALTDARYHQGGLERCQRAALTLAREIRDDLETPEERAEREQALHDARRRA